MIMTTVRATEPMSIALLTTQIINMQSVN